MGRISEEELDRLKKEASLEKRVREFGVKLKRQGKDLVGLCPFHDDKEPSLVISPSKNLWNCLGACNSGGSVIDWVMKAEGISFRHALELLREGGPSQGEGIRKPVSLVNPEASESETLGQVVDFYHGALLKNPTALNYLDKRGINKPELVKHFKLGVCDRSLGYHLPRRSRKDGALIRSRLQELGILKASGHEHFRGSLVIPVLDEKEQVAELYGRKLDPRKRPEHLYLPGPHRGVFNLAGFKDADEVILCESLIDALSFWARGHHHVTTSYGINGFTAELRAAIKSRGIKKLFIAYDSDEAGSKAAQELAEELMREGLKCYRVELPWGLDVNEYLVKNAEVEDCLDLVLKRAKWMGRGPVPRPTTIKETAKREEEAEPEAKETKAKAKVQAKQEGEDLHLFFGDRRYRVRGLARNTSFEVLRINLLASRGETFHIDTFDLYSARPRLHFIKETAHELGVEADVIKRDVGKVLLALEDIQEQRINEAQEPKNKVPEMSEEEQEQALELLKDPQLIERILSDFNACGVIGEESNKLLGYLATVSRKLDGPLAVIIQSSSAAGKSSLMEAILAFMPPEEQVKYSALTGQSLFYMGEGIDLRHKVLAIVEEEGAQKASYALKLLQSEGELTIASTGKDPVSGRLTTQEYSVEGPVMLMLTTTAVEIDEELLNRCIVLSVSEDRKQTKAIHEAQRKRRTIAGLRAKHGKDKILKLHRNAQRLLRSLSVVNPYAERLTFLDDRTRMRRDHEKYLPLIEAIALLHQKQRAIHSEVIDGEECEYIEVQSSDIALANQLADEILGRSLDEMPPQTRLLLDKLEEMIGGFAELHEMERDEVRFTRRDVRDFTGWSYDQVRVHLSRIIELEYVLVHRGSRGQSFVHELLYAGRGKDGRSFLMGLLDANQLNETTKHSLGGEGAGFGVPLGGHLAPIGRPLGLGKSGHKTNKSKDLGQSLGGLAKQTHKANLKSRVLVNAKVDRNGTGA